MSKVIRLTMRKGTRPAASRRKSTTTRYVSRTPTRVSTGRIVVHNHVRPRGFPNVDVGQDGFRIWTDASTPKDYRVVACRCGWAPHLRQHFRVKRPASTAAPTPEARISITRNWSA